MGPSPKEARRLRIVVCDTGPILHLRESRVLDLLPAVGNVIVPRAVDEELRRLLPDWRHARPKWLKVRVVRKARMLDPAIAQLTRELGAGEVEAIALALALPADWLLTDDAEARALANLIGLEVHGSLGVILQTRSFTVDRFGAFGGFDSHPSPPSPIPTARLDRPDSVRDCLSGDVAVSGG